MELYVKFMFMLTVGLVGVGLVLTTLIETVFSDWDPFVDFQIWWGLHAHGRARASSVRAASAAPSTLDRRAPSTSIVEAL